MAKSKIVIGGSKIMILGLTFKKNCSDIRNTQVVEINKILKEYDLITTIVDPFANKLEAKRIYGIDILNQIPSGKNYAATIVAVGHDYFKNLGEGKWREIKNMSNIIMDVNGILPRDISTIRI